MNEKKNNNSVNLVDLFFYLLSNWYWFVICVAICVGFAYYRYSKIQHMYRSQATIIIKDPSNTRYTVQMGTYSNLINHVSMSNEILQLQTRELMSDVVRSLDANIDYMEMDRLREVELYRSAPVRMFVPRNDSGDYAFELRVTPLSDSTLAISGKDMRKKSVAFGDTVSVYGHNVTFAPTPTCSSYYGKDIRIRILPVVNRAYEFISRLHVTQAETDGSILRLSITDFAHDRADDVLNTLVRKYNEDAIREKTRIAVNTAAFINERLAIIQDELGSVEEDLSRLKTSERILNVDATAADYLSQNTALNKEIVELETKLSTARYLRDYVKSSFQAYETIPANIVTEDTYIEGAIQKYNAAVRERERLVKSGGEYSLAVSQIEDNIKVLRGDVNDFIDTHISLLITQRQSLAEREQESLQKLLVCASTLNK